MRTVIIEDEALTAEDLRQTLERLGQGVEVVRILRSVQEAVDYFHDVPDHELIFSDIELGDGKCFEIFRQVGSRAPVVFTTAYDHFALEAFKHNGIDYILKPYREDELMRAVNKWKGLRRNIDSEINELLATLSALRPMAGSTGINILVNWKDRIIPLRTSEIAFFGLDAGNSFLVTMDGRRFPAQETLEEYAHRCGSAFFRVNRQFLVNREAVSEVVHHTHRKMLVRLKSGNGEEIILAKARVAEFLEWLEA